MSLEGGPKPHIEHISEDSEAYQESRAERAERVDSYDRAFGEFEIAGIDVCRKSIAEIEKDAQANLDDKGNLPDWLEEEKERWQKDIDKQITRIKEQLAKKFENDYSSFRRFMEEMLTSDEITTMLQERLQKHGYDRDPLLAIVLAFKEGDGVSDAELEMMVRTHVHAHHERRNEFNERLPDMLAEFRDRSIRAIQDGYLPIDVEHLEKRMAETHVYLADPIETKECSAGTYNLAAGVIKIVPEASLEKQQKTVFHEMIHALGGRTIIHKTKEGIPTKVDHQRSGLGFDGVDTNNEYERRFRWIDEAVTEDIALYLAKLTEGSYEDEREALNELYNKGLSRDVVYKAYFENYDPDSKNKVPAWKALTSQLSEIIPEMPGTKALLHFEEVERLEKEKKEEQWKKIREITKARALE